MRIYFASLGCDKNLVDSEVMLGIIKSGGHEIVVDETEAEIAVINTCAFISEAVSEGIENILELARLKETAVLKKLIVAGCMPARFKNDIFKNIPEVDAIIGPAEKESIAEVIDKVIDPAEKERVVCLYQQPDAVLTDTASNQTIATKTLTSKPDVRMSERLTTTPSHYAYLKIAEGCDNRCTYCAIPSIRGGYRSAEIDALVYEAALLAKRGVRELILVAQDTSLYGTDIYHKPSLHILLKNLSEIQGVERIRILYCYPEHITDEIIYEIANNPKICKYLDIPVQHADDKILKLMGRRSTNSGLKDIISKLRVAVPGIILRTTVITGFPGEGEAEYSTLKEFINEIKFDKLGAFAYSRELGTPAYSLPMQVKSAVKKQRQKGIMHLQKEISAEKRKTYIGSTLAVMVDGWLPEDEVYCGRSYMDAPDIDGLVFFSCQNELISGDTVTVKITGSADYDLIGEVIYESSE